MKGVLRLLTAFFLVATLEPNASFAATNSWDGGGSGGNWGTALNWQGDIVPFSGADLSFDAFSNLIVTNNLSTNTYPFFRSFVFNSGGYQVYGNPAEGGALYLRNGIYNNSGFNIFNAPVFLGNGTNLTIFAQDGSTLVFNQTVTMNSTAAGGENGYIIGNSGSTKGEIFFNGGFSNANGTVPTRIDGVTANFMTNSSFSGGIHMFSAGDANFYGGSNYSTYTMTVFGGGGNGNTISVTGAGTYLQVSHLNHGRFGSDNRVIVSDGATMSVAGGGAELGNYGGANNQIVVSGAGSRFNGFIAIQLASAGGQFDGNGSFGNKLIVTNGGYADAFFMEVGTADTAGNLIYVAGSNSVLYAPGWLNVGVGVLVGGMKRSYANALVIENGGVVTSGVASVGARLGWSVYGNTGLVSGAGSLWKVNGDLTLAMGGFLNEIIVTNQGRIEANNAYIGSSTLDGANTNFGWSNLWSVSGGSLFVSNGAASGDIIVGNGRSRDNIFKIENNGVVTANGRFLISSGTSYSSNNSVNINGGTLFVTNSAGTGVLVVGDSGSAFLRMNGGTAIVDHLFFTNTSYGSSVVFNGGLLETRGDSIMDFAANPLTFGDQYLGSTTWRLAAGAGSLPGSGTVVLGNFLASTGRIEAISGTSRLSAAGRLIVGSNGVGILSLTNGGSADVGGNITVGQTLNFGGSKVEVFNGSALYNTNATGTTLFDLRRGSLVVASNGLAVVDNLLLTNGADGLINVFDTIYLGSSTMPSSGLRIGTAVGSLTNVAANITAGGIRLGSGATTGSVSIVGGVTAITNSGGTAEFYVNRGDVTLSSRATLVADKIILTNTTGSFSFQGGTALVRSVDFDNGQVFTVGNGLSNSLLGLIGSGLYRFDEGVIINTNAIVSGSGELRTGTLPEVRVRSSGTLDPDGVLTNTGNLVLESGARLNMSEPDLLVVNGNFTNSATFSIFSAGGSVSSNFNSGIKVGGFYGNTGTSNITWYFNSAPEIGFLGGMQSTNNTFAGLLNTFVIDGAPTAGYYGRSIVAGTNINSGVTNHTLMVTGLASIVWNGAGTSDNWNTDTNWVGLVAPTSGQGLNFGTVGASRLNNTNNFSNFAFGTITFSNGGYTAHGNALTLNEGIYHKTGTNTFNPNITLGSNQWIYSESGKLVLGGSITGVTKTLTYGGGGDTYVQGIVSGTVSVLKLGTGTLYVVNTNSYTGTAGTAIEGGGVVVSGLTARITHSARNMTVGGTNGGTLLVIRDGGGVTNSVGNVGLFSSSTGNTVVVQDSGTTWRSGGGLVLGSLGGLNRVIVSNLGRISAAATIMGAESSSNQLLVSGGSFIGNAGFIYVGTNGSYNEVIVTNAGTLSNATAIIGLASGSNNAVRVDGSGSIWNNAGTVTHGSNSANNVISVGNAGRVNGTVLIVGGAASANNNSVVVTDANSIYTNTSAVTIGNAGSGNSLIVSNGATFAAGSLNVGVSNGSRGNSIVVTDSGSRIINSGSFVIGNTGELNTLSILNGGSVSNAFAVIGTNSESRNNSVLVSGAGSTWINAGDLWVSAQGLSNSLRVSSGGQVVVQSNLIMGVGVGSVGAIEVLGGGLVVTNGSAAGGVVDLRRGAFDFKGGTSYVGMLLVTNTLENASTFQAGNLNLYKGAVFSNSSLYFGTLSNSAFSLILNSGTISNQISSSVTPNTYLGSVAGATGGIIINSGSWGDVGRLYVGGSGVGLVNVLGGFMTNQLIVADSDGSSVVVGGGMLVSSAASTFGNVGGGTTLRINNGGLYRLNDSLTFGQGLNSDNNMGIVSGAGSQLIIAANSLYIGNNGSSNSLILSNGGYARVTGSTILGNTKFSLDNTLTINGSTFVNTNSTGLIDVRRGTVNLSNNGEIYANNLNVYTNSTFNPDGNVTNNGNVILQYGARLEMQTNDHLVVNGNFSNSANFIIEAAGGAFGIANFRGVEVNGFFTNMVLSNSITWRFDTAPSDGYIGAIRSTNNNLSVLADSGILSLDGTITPGQTIVDKVVVEGATTFYTFGVESGVLRVWDGGSGVNNNWTQAPNWSNDQVPLNNGSELLVFAGSVRPNPLTDVAWDVRGIRFDRNSTNFNLSGSNITLGLKGINQNSTNRQIINNNIVLSSNAPIRANFGNLVLAGVIDSAGYAINAEGFYTLDFSNNITGNGSFIKAGGGSAYLNGGT
ncbi:MAG: hypothetical protein SGI71_03080, partial [Verrucomicrobiota bacterium]|nr:hypothetical protein [Verrucomicrobiota bacterium]